MKKIVSVLVLSSFALGACATAPYKTSNIDKNQTQLNAPQSFEHTLKAGDYMTPVDWWTAFNDPVINRLVAKLLEKNPDMAEAGLKLEKARLNAEFTQLDAKPIYSGSVSASENIDKDGNNSESFSVSTGVSYQLDLWGKLRAAQDIAKWEINATEGDLQATRLTLIGTAINYYWQIAYLHEQISDANATIDYARKILEIVHTQYKNGAASGIEFAEAEQNLHSQIASLAALEQTLVETRNSLAILLDGEKWGEEATKIPDFKYSEIAPGIPAQILARRPDMRAAELRLKQSLVDVEIARLKMYPDISLTGSLGSSSDELIKVLNNPILALGVDATLPFLNVRQNELSTDIARKAYEIAVVEYRKIFLTALFDVDNALSNGQKLKIQAEHYALNLDAAKRAETRYKARYKEGAEALRVWLDAQEQLRTAQLQYDNARLSQLTNRATLYQALGGDGVAFADKN